jgi:hypothetical protein
MTNRREERMRFPQYLALEGGSYGRRRQEDYVTLDVQLDSDWIALIYLVGYGGQLAISEVRLLPCPRNGLEESRLAAARKRPARVRVTAGPPNPKTGIAIVTGDDVPPHLAAGTLRNLLAEEAIKVAKSGLPMLSKDHAGINGRALKSSVRRIKRKPTASPYEIAVVAAHYVEVVRAGGRGNEDVAPRLDGYSVQRARRAISRARNLGFLPPTKQGRQGERAVTLTAKARRVLADGPPAGYVGPALEAARASR